MLPFADADTTDLLTEHSRYQYYFEDVKKAEVWMSQRLAEHPEEREEIELAISRGHLWFSERGRGVVEVRAPDLSRRERWAALCAEINRRIPRSV